VKGKIDKPAAIKALQQLVDDGDLKGFIWCAVTTDGTFTSCFEGDYARMEALAPAITALHLGSVDDLLRKGATVKIGDLTVYRDSAGHLVLAGPLGDVTLDQEQIEYLNAVIHAQLRWPGRETK